MKERWLVRITGVVQGVGFRPYVYNMAQNYNLGGIVGNDTKGVFLEIEGQPEILEAFLTKLPVSAPPMAKIETVSVIARNLAVSNTKDFAIVESLIESEKQLVIPVDVGYCSECEEELLNPEDRRYLYPFINCTNCGPRYTIINDLPYDRKNTTMDIFSMCPDCEKEYHNPSNRRFHAQPNACWVCGPQVFLLDNYGKKLAAGIEAIRKTGELLAQGYILAIKGLGGFHLACDASNSEAVRKLRERKGREEKALALMAKDIDAIDRVVHLSESAKSYLKGPEKPILLLPKKLEKLLSPEIAPFNSYFGVMLPYTPLHRILFEFSPTYLVMTSGNRTDEPIVYKNEEALAELSEIADFFLVHNREIRRRCDDTVAAIFSNQIYMIRRSRGFAPSALKLSEEFNNVLAVGAEQKNTIALAKGRNVVLSQHLGDLGNAEAYHAFTECIEDLLNFLAIQPSLIIHDLHPEYLSTKWAEEQSVPRQAIQHHEAHIGSCMFEHQLAEPVIGFAFDGTGYGHDGLLWGSEVLVGDGITFDRVAHLFPIPLLGGEKAIKNVWRIGYVLQELANIERKIFKKKYWQEINVLREMLSKKLNVYDSTGMGRLFDGFSSLLGLHEKTTYDGQAAVGLENLAKNANNTDLMLEFELIENEKWIWDWRPLVRQAVDMLEHGIDRASIAYAFHMAVARSVTKMASILRDKYKINKVCLSGGVFLNHILLEACVQSLKKAKFQVYYHSQIPCNDGGIAAGQIYLAFLRRNNLCV